MRFKKLVVLDKVDLFDDQEKRLRELADEVIIHSDTAKTKEEIRGRVGNADAVITSWTDLSADDINSWSDVKYLGVYATGYSWIDVKAAMKKGVTVTNVPGYATESVAEMVMCQLLSLVRKSRQADKFVRETGKFERNEFQGEELAGKTMGIIGMGRIGTRVAELAAAFNMRVVYHSRTKKDLPYDYCESLDEMIQECDVVSLHASSGDEFLNAERLAKLPNNAVVINFGAAGGVNEDALIKELQKNRLRACIDHFCNHKVREELRRLENAVILSPEIGYYTRQALKNLMKITINNARSYLKGNTQNKIEQN